MSAIVVVDFVKKTCEVVEMRDIEGEPEHFAMSIDLSEGRGQKEIFFEKPTIKPNNAITDELESFAEAIINNTTPPVTVEDGYKALDVAYKIQAKLKMNTPTRGKS